MQIHGLNKTTLLDYPGRLACTVFTGACNFRCPFCQNSDLVINPMSQPKFDEEEIFRHLTKRKGIITGVCITGGEPTLQADLPDFIRRIKDMNVSVKLDTNGYRPDVVKELAKEKLIDYIAMDIKSSPLRYSEAAGCEVDFNIIQESISLIMNLGIDYEFRTTVVRELHDEKVFADIANLLEGAEQYYLQGFVESERVLKSGLSGYTFDELSAFRNILMQKIHHVDIRGID